MNKKVFNPHFLYRERKNDSFNIAYVLLRYNLSLVIIQIHTDISYKMLKQMYEDIHGNTKNRIKQSSRYRSPTFIISESKTTTYGYNELILLYCRYHSSDPNKLLDINALLMAWNIYNNHHRCHELSINDLWNICNFMKIEGVKDLDTDGVRLIYSKEYNTYYVHSNNSRYDENTTGFIKLKSLKDIKAKLQKEAKIA
ncbi:MAG: hypothetical protein U0M61_10360 [Succinivibrio sp.]|nr:hypothetical protein [Succinivibrio sp.]